MHLRRAAGGRRVGDDSGAGLTEAKRLRLFVALELPSAWRTALAAEAHALESAAPGFGRWVDPSLMHITLAFLGYQEQVALPAIQRAMEEAAASDSFSLRLTSPGSFGGRRALRVVWVGVEDRPRGALARLHASVAAQLQAAHVSFDNAPFRAHITLGRARRDASPARSDAMHVAIGRRGATSDLPRTEPLQAEVITLMRSDLRPSGATYTPLFRAPLAGRHLTESV